MSKEQEERNLSTADLVAGAQAPSQRTGDRAPDRMADRIDERDRLDDRDRLEGRVSDRELGQPVAGSSTDVHREAQLQTEPLAALFTPEVAGDFQSRWDAVQIGFVDDPGAAVRKADELVAQVMKSLAESFATERDRIENQLDQSDHESTENMRVALRRYRSFFQRLLSL